ncbi:hypothetical protein O9929_03730 [Vibrio lentus]|nr:hypothetical protein [Vibrio lentus]
MIARVHHPPINVVEPIPARASIKSISDSRWCISWNGNASVFDGSFLWSPNDMSTYTTNQPPDVDTGPIEWFMGQSSKYDTYRRLNAEQLPY